MTIYETVPADTEYEEDQAVCVKEYLRANKEKTFKARDIAKECGLPSSGTQVKLRKIITVLLEEEGCPIISRTVSNPKGFSWTEKEESLRRCALELEGRKLGLDRRLKAVLRLADEKGNKIIGDFDSRECNACGVRRKKDRFITNDGVCVYCNGGE